MTNQTNTNPLNSENATFLDFAKTTAVNASHISEKSIDANLECTLKYLDLCESCLHTINQQLLSGGLPPEKENRLERERKDCLNSAYKVQKSSQKSIRQSRRSYYCFAAGLILALVISLFLFCQSQFPQTSALDNPGEVCYTEPYDNNTEAAPEALPE